MSDEKLRLRTDVIVSCINGRNPPVSDFVKALENEEITDKDKMALLPVSEPAQYAMRDLEAPLPPSEMVIPTYQSYLAGHSKLSSSYATDWPTADAENNLFGEHHPLGLKSNSFPLLRGSEYGEPHYVDHLFDFIDHIAENHAEGERRNKNNPMQAKIMGQPQRSILDLYNKDKTTAINSGMTEEEWTKSKRERLTNRFGMLPYFFGLEWSSEDQTDAFMDILSKLGNTEKLDSPDAKRLLNSIQEKSGITWDRAIRSWRDRFTPMKAWWMRASDRHGPTSSGEDFFHSPFINDEEGHNYHWWQPFQYLGGVGRDEKSLHDLLNQSYPKIFNDSWLNDYLTSSVPIQGNHMLNGSHFPQSSNAVSNNPTLSSHVTPMLSDDVSYDRRRASANHALTGDHRHPSEIEGMGNRTLLPPEAFMTSRLGRSMIQISDMGKPRAGPYRQEHPNSNEAYHRIHNQHYLNSEDAMIDAMRNLSMNANAANGGNDLFSGMGTDRNANAIARGNIGQLMAAANYKLLRGTEVNPNQFNIPNYTQGMPNMGKGMFGPVHPNSQAVIPPLGNHGNNDAWGHEMPSTLGWKWNRDANDIEFSIRDKPFNILQRTPHEGMVSAINPSWRSQPINSKMKEINAFATNPLTGYPALHMLHKSDDYEPTGVFESLIEPAHVVHDLDDMDTLKGFSGEWIVQKKPKGKHVLVKKKGKSVEPMSLPSKVKKSLKDTIKGDVIFDAYLKGDVLTVVDLLLHKGTDMHLEPLSDRVNVLRTLYATTDNVHFPSPNSCVNTDQDGLMKTVAFLDKSDLLIRDAYSTFMKGNEVHPKWVLYPQDDISKSMPLPPLPELSVKGTDIILEYPSILHPVIVKTDKDENGRYIVDYEGLPHLIKHAKSQIELWNPVVALHINELNDALVHIPSYSSRPVFKKGLDKAPQVITEEDENDEDSIPNIMRHARKAITREEVSLPEKKLISMVDGLTSKILDNYAGEYGLERADDGKWTVNEAIDDDIAEKFAFPRMNRASADGGAWAGMQADITAPTGPTEISEEENTTFGSPKLKDELVDSNQNFKQMKLIVGEGDSEATVEVTEDKAVVRFPRHEKGHEEKENEVLPVSRNDDIG
mgnify:CR=1 FL=1|tara:strand:- start:774 stop:4097 length:3324 start_codon:yes stop_codon:yes gene_type:complete